MSFLSRSSSQGDSKGSKAPPSKHVSKGAEGTGSSFPGFPSKMKNLFAKRSEGSKASSDSQQPSSNNENPETDTESALSQHVSKGAEGTGSSISGISSKMKNPFKKRSEGSKASSDSQQPSPNNENPKTDTVPPPQKDANGKTTFQPKNLSIFSEEESQAWTISERDGTAELLEVCWLDVTGSMTATKGKEYEISFILSMNENKENSFGWEDPVYVMARIGEEDEYKRVKIDLSKLGPNKEKFPKEENCRVKNAENNEKKLYFGLYEVWTNNWKGGLRIHEAIVQEIKDGNNASTSNTLSDDSKVQEATADKSTSASENPPDLSRDNEASTAISSQRAQKITVHDSASTTNHVNYFAAPSRVENLEDVFYDSKESLEDK